MAPSICPTWLDGWLVEERKWMRWKGRRREGGRRNSAIVPSHSPMVAEQEKPEAPSSSLPHTRTRIESALPFPTSRREEEGRGRRNLDKHQDEKGTINNCIRIYDVLYGDPWLNGQSRRREGRKEGLTVSLLLVLLLSVSGLPPFPPLQLVPQPILLHFWADGEMEEKENASTSGR